jgi:hypothetical protein
LAHLPYELFGRQPNKGIWQTLPVTNSKMAKLPVCTQKWRPCRYELKNGDLAGVNNNG